MRDQLMGFIPIMTTGGDVCVGIVPPHRSRMAVVSEFGSFAVVYQQDSDVLSYVSVT